MTTNDEEVVDALLNAGIGKRFHKRTLNEFGEVGAMMAKGLKETTIPQSLRDGHGYTLVGKESFDLIHVFARGLLLCNIGVCVKTLGDMEDDLAVYGFLQGNLAEVSVLVIPRFAISGMKECPIPANRIFRIENMLEARMSMGLPVVLQANEDLERAEWWSSDFLQLVSKFNHVIRV